MGLMLDKSGIAERLMLSAQELFGKVRGGLAITVTLIGVLLAASTGIVGASVVLLGLLSSPAMLNQGYSKTLALGTVASAGTLGILIPPSIMLVVMGDQLSLSVGDLFLGAVFPGLVLAGMYLVFLLLYSYLRPSLCASCRRQTAHIFQNHLACYAERYPACGAYYRSARIHLCGDSNSNGSFCCGCCGCYDTRRQLQKA